MWIELGSGLDRDQALKLLAGGCARLNPSLLNAISARMAASNYDVNFLLSLMAKDLRYSSLDAATFDPELRLANTAEARFAEASTAGYQGKDMSAVIEPLRAKVR